jgi:hypothetical protein
VRASQRAATNYFYFKLIQTRCQHEPEFAALLDLARHGPCSSTIAFAVEIGFPGLNGPATSPARLDSPHGDHSASKPDRILTGIDHASPPIGLRDRLP